jgi:hypothetical protein
MTPRPLARTRPAGLARLLALALGLVALAGCDPRQALFFLQPMDPTVAPKGPSLKNKRVVLITKASPVATNDFPTIDRELNREVARILKEKIRHLDLVDQEKVWGWDKTHPTWTEPSELAEKFEADLVIFLEIGEFAIQSPSSPDLYEGRSVVNIQVTELAYPKDDKGRPQKDRPKEAEVVFRDEHPTTFPSRGPMPVSADFTRGSFKNRFLKLVANEISWSFVEHAHGDDIQDVRFGRD